MSAPEFTGLADPPRAETARRLRVLHVLSTISLKRGGPSVAVRNMLRALHMRGVQADVVTTDDDGPNAHSSVPLGQFVELENQRAIYFPRQTNFYYASAPLASWLSTHIGRYNIVHTHGLFAMAPIVAARLARRRCIPYIMRPAGMLDSWSRAHRRPFLKRSSIALVEGPLLSSAARVHFTSQIELHQASEIGARIHSVVLPLGLDLDAPISTKAEIERFAPFADSKIVLFLSRIDYKKGLDVLIRAFAEISSRHADAVLVIAGDGPPPLLAELRALAAELNVAHRIFWLGFVQGDEKRWLLRRSALFALPSASENFGVAVAEAMAAGLPLILSRGVALSEVVAKRNAGIVTDGSPRQVAEALHTLLTDEPLRHRQGASARQAAHEEFSLDLFGQRLETLYRTVLSR